MIYNSSMATDLVETLERHPVFTCLSETEREEIAKAAIVRHYQSGDILVHAGDTWPYLFLVAEGSVSALKESTEGRSLVAAKLEQGELFWGLAFFDEDIPNPVSFQISQPACLYLWERGVILPILLKNGQLAWELSRLMVKRMLHASDIIDGLAFQPVAGRLARLLMEFPNQETPGPIARSLTLDEMAARIGSTREMVCRFLQRFADNGLIKITRTEFEITNRDGLTEMAQKVKP
jgi:CRP-like cAMP-binding protein